MIFTLGILSFYQSVLPAAADSSFALQATTALPGVLLLVFAAYTTGFINTTKLCFHHNLITPPFHAPL
jgi:hypothetical protein